MSIVQFLIYGNYLQHTMQWRYIIFLIPLELKTIRMLCINPCFHYWVTTISTLNTVPVYSNIKLHLLFIQVQKLMCTMVVRQRITCHMIMTTILLSEPCMLCIVILGVLHDIVLQEEFYKIRMMMVLCSWDTGWYMYQWNLIYIPSNHVLVT